MKKLLVLFLITIINIPYAFADYYYNTPINTSVIGAPSYTQPGAINPYLIQPPYNPNGKGAGAGLAAGAVAYGLWKLFGGHLPTPEEIYKRDCRKAREAWENRPLYVTADGRYTKRVQKYQSLEKPNTYVYRDFITEEEVFLVNDSKM